MPATLTEVIAAQCERTGLPVPASVMGSSDRQIVQMRALLEEVCGEIASAGRWRDLVAEKSFTTLGDTGQISLIEPLTNPYFRYIIPCTFWDRTNHLPLLPTSPVDWQFMLGMSITGLQYQFRIRGSDLLVTPIPPAGLLWSFEYVHSAWCLSFGGGKDRFTLDSDTIMFPRDLVKLGLRWKWKKEKGLSYQEDFNSFQVMLVDALARDETSSTLYQDYLLEGARPGVFVPYGNWVTS